MVTIVEIARLAQVSKSTVSSVLNDSRGSRVGEATRKRVHAVAQQLGYSTNQAARSLRSGHSRLIGLLFNPDEKFVISDVITGVENVLHRRNYHTVLCSYNSPEDLNSRLEALRSKRPDGWLVINEFGVEYDDTMLALCDGGTPVAIIGGSRHVPRMLAVYVDPAAIVREAVRHIRANGHRQVIFAAAYRTGFLELFRTEWHRAGGDFAADCRALPPLSGFDSGRTVLQHWQPERRESAVLAYDDLMAAGILYEAHRQGIAVPDELSVLGIDNYPICDLLWPKLTTIDQDHMRQGENAAQLLLDHLENPDGQPQIALVEPRLIERESFCRKTERNNP